MSMIGSFTKATTMTFDTITQLLIAINRLARAGAHRTRVVEDKSVNAACISKLRNEYDVAREVQEIYKDSDDISEEAVIEGKAVVARFKAEIAGESTPAAVQKVTSAIADRLADEVTSRVQKGDNGETGETKDK